MKKNYLNVSLRVLKSVFILFLCTTLSAGSIYVSKDPNRSRDYATIQDALDAANPGDVIHVKSGVYYETLEWNTSGNSGSPIILQSYNGEDVYIDGSNASNSWPYAMIYIHDKSNIIIRDLVIRNNMRNGANGIFIDGYGSDITISDVKIHDMNWSTDPDEPGPNGNSAHAIHILGNNSSGLGLEDITVEGCWIHDCNTAWSEALTVNGNVNGFLIENNVVEDIWNIGIDLAGFWNWTQAPFSVNYARNGVVRGNTVSGCISPWATSAGIYTDGAQDVVIENNVVYGNGFGIELGMENPYTVSNLICRNNLIYENLNGGIALGAAHDDGMVTNSKLYGNTLYRNDLDAGSSDWAGEIKVQNSNNNEIFGNIIETSDHVNKKAIMLYSDRVDSLDIDYNLFWRATAGTSSMLDYGSGNTYSYGTHNVLADPDFVSTSTDDYHIESSSPAKDAGDGGFTPASGEEDMDGQERVYNSTMDIGADEYGSSSSSNPTISGVTVSNDATYLVFDVSGSGLGDGYNLFINSDNSSSTGYQDGSYTSSGADYLVENGNLYVSTGSGWNWSQVSGATVNSTHTEWGAYISIDKDDFSSLSSTITYAYSDLENWSEIVASPASGSYASATTTSATPTISNITVTEDATYLIFDVSGSDLGDGYDLFINTDNSSSTGYQDGSYTSSGADYLVENGNLYMSTGSGWNWSQVSGATVNSTHTEWGAYISIDKDDFSSLSSTITYAYSDLENWSEIVASPESGSYASASVSGSGDASSICVNVQASIDDVEELADGSISTTSSDLELSEDGSNNQQIGLRFQGVWIPQGSTITSAYIQFSCDETSSGTTDLRIRAENEYDSDPFTTTAFDVSGRNWTSNYVSWSPSAWNIVGERSSAQRTPDLSSIIQVVVNRSGWIADNDMSFKISGDGVRTAESYDGSSSAAAQLCVEFISSLKSAEGKPMETFSANAEVDMVLAYPNPVRDVLYLNNIPEQTTIQLYDMTGKLVLEKQNQNQINVSDLNSGLYIMSVNTRSESKRIMITKQ